MNSMKNLSSKPKRLCICRFDFSKIYSAGVFIFEKSTTFAVSKQEVRPNIKQKDEKDISAIEKKESKQAWFQGKDVNSKWKESSCCPQGKRKKKAYGFSPA